MGLPGAAFEAPKRCQNQLKIGSEKWFRRLSGGRCLSDFWAPKNPPEAHFVLYFTRCSAFRGVGEGTSKGLFYGFKKVLKNCPKRASKRVPKWAPEGRPRPQKGNMGALPSPARSRALLHKPPLLGFVLGFVFVFGCLVLCLCL